MLDNTHTISAPRWTNVTPTEARWRRMSTVFVVLLTWALVGSGCASHQQATRGQWAGGALVAGGAVTMVVGANRYVNLDNGNALNRLLFSPHIMATGLVAALTGAGILTISTVERSRLSRDEVDERMRIYAGPQPPPSSSSPLNETELNLILDDICAITPDACLAVRTCILCDDPVACDAVDALVADGTLSPLVWRYLQSHSGE